MKSALEQLKEMTVIVADTGDPALVRKHKPQDCTTNPSLVLAAMSADETQGLVAEEIARAKAQSLSVEALCDTLTVALGANLAALVPGRVSTEVDASLSFDVEGSVRRAQDIVEDYHRRGIKKDRILIKLAATWEGIRAAEQLEKDGINCNLTLLFSLEQAKACADTGVYLISPFVGRITDWYNAAEQFADDPPKPDPGVKSVREIFEHYKSHGIETIVMGASFRNTGQIKALAGCDRLTIVPTLLSELAEDNGPVPHVLQSGGPVLEPEPISENDFRWGVNQNAMAAEKLAEGIRGFERDHRMLLEFLATRLMA